jgi:hypothetical protein
LFFGGDKSDINPTLILHQFYIKMAGSTWLWLEAFGRCAKPGGKDAKSLGDKTPLRDPCVRKLLTEAKVKSFSFTSKDSFTKDA